MVAVLDAPPPVRRTPRPDPFPQHQGTMWQRHVPWIVASIGLAIVVTMPNAVRGWAVGGAAAMALAQAFTQRRLRASCRALHLGAGLAALCAWHGLDAAGSFAVAVAAMAVAAQIAFAAASQFQPQVAPLAGRLPWRFQPAYRHLAFRFGGAGLVIALGVALAAPQPELQIAGIAIFPLFLRTYIGTLLAARTTRAIWIYAIVMHWAALGFFVPAYGALAAAWILVGAETVLFVGSAMVIARRTGIASARAAQWAAGSALALLIAAVTVPHTPEWPFFASILIGVGIGAVFFPRATAR